MLSGAERRPKMIGSIETGKSEKNLQLTQRSQHVIRAHRGAVGWIITSNSILHAASTN